MARIDFSLERKPLLCKLVEQSFYICYFRFEVCKLLQRVGRYVFGMYVYSGACWRFGEATILTSSHLVGTVSVNIRPTVVPGDLLRGSP
jgi:hypothetical protein